MIFPKKNDTCLFHTIRLFISLTLLCSSMTYAGTLEGDDFYRHLWLQSREIMDRTWEAWTRFPGERKAQDWYLGGLLAYQKNETEKAEVYFEKAMTSSREPWIVESAKQWRGHLRGRMEGIVYPHKASHRMLSEMAVLEKEKGKEDAWRIAFQALEEARSKGEPLRAYWTNLALSAPPDISLWQEALRKATVPDEECVFFNPALFQALYRMKRAVRKDGSAETDLFSEHDAEIAKTRQAIQSLQKEFSQEIVWKHHSNLFWRMAWLYGERGIVRAGEHSGKDLQTSLTLYDFLFEKSRRGDLSSFDPVALMQMSRVMFAGRRYDEMLFYLYRPEACDSFRYGPCFRPALQFLSACQMMERNPSSSGWTD